MRMSAPKAVIPKQTPDDKPVPLPPPPVGSIIDDQSFMLASKRKYAAVLGGGENLNASRGKNDLGARPPKSTGYLSREFTYSVDGAFGQQNTRATPVVTPTKTASTKTTPAKSVLG